MVNAQEYINQKYPTEEQRKNIIILDLSNKDLEGDLDLTDFINLVKTNVSGNPKLNKITIPNYLKNLQEKAKLKQTIENKEKELKDLESELENLENKLKREWEDKLKNLEIQKTQIEVLPKNPSEIFKKGLY